MVGQNCGRAPLGQALAVPATPANAVDGPTGFDPSRIAEMLQEISPRMLEPIIRSAADNFYCQVLDAVDGYLLENIDHNMKSHIAMLERENKRMRTELYEVDRKLGGNPLGHERRIESIGELATASSRYYSMLWAVSQKHEGEERHETALRYIREREAAQGIEAQRAATVEQGAVHESPVGEADAPKGSQGITQ